MKAAVSEYRPRGLNAYFAAVSARGLSREDKLNGIVNCFSPDAVLITSDGSELHGHDGVRSFYGSELSPVMQRDDFTPRQVGNTLCWSDDGLTCAVILDLPEKDDPEKDDAYQRVGDFFEFDAMTGKIIRLTVFSQRQQLLNRQHGGRRGSSGGRVGWIVCCMTVTSLLQAAIMMRKAAMCS